MNTSEKPAAPKNWVVAIVEFDETGAPQNVTLLHNPKDGDKAGLWTKTNARMLARAHNLTNALPEPQAVAFAV